MQTEYIGNSSIENIKKLISDLDHKRVLIVTGKKSFKESSSKLKLSKLLKGFEVERFSDFDVNPNIDDVQIGINKIRLFEPEIIIAIGGGSVIDIAKLINILAANTTKDSNLHELIMDSTFVSKKGLPLIAIPTTSGTGSEATHFAVIYIKNKKYSFAHKYVKPEFAIIDPSLSFSTSPYVAACSAFDALSQAIESFWSVGSTEESRQYSRTSISMILNSIESAINLKETNAMESMSIAANLAGKAINISKTTAAHAISYPITKQMGIPHGHAVALTLGKFFIINYCNNKELINDYRGHSHLINIMQELFDMFNVSNAEDCCKKWLDLMSTIGLANDLPKIFKEKSINYELIASDINIERLQNNPIKVTSIQIKNLFYHK